MKLFNKVSTKLALGIIFSLLTSTAFASGPHCSAFYIQLIVTSSPGKAHGMKKSFTQLGFTTEIEPYKSNNKTLYRVKNGPYRSLNTVKQAHDKMKSLLKGNPTAQQSIITETAVQCDTTPQPVKPKRITSLQGNTQCYRNNDPKLVIAIQLTEHNSHINGYYFSRPEGMDGGYGYIKGRLNNNRITGKFHYTVEGDVGSEDVNYYLRNGTLLDGPSLYRQVSCSSVKNEIDVAIDVSAELQSNNQSSNSNSNRTSLRFSQFKAPATYRGINHPLVMDEFSHTFRTRLRQAIKNQTPSFAGEYIVTNWGCGSSGCNTGAVINARTGVATPLPVALASVFPLKSEFSNENGQEHIYRLDSRLMIFAGNVSGARDNGNDSIEFYEFKNGAFKFLESRPYGRAKSF